MRDASGGKGVDAPLVPLPGGMMPPDPLSYGFMSDPFRALSGTDRIRGRFERVWRSF
ncbi:hypothetical protein Bwad005_37750 [Bilophila wadsworthia]